MLDDRANGRGGKHRQPRASRVDGDPVRDPGGTEEWEDAEQHAAAAHEHHGQCDRHDATATAAPTISANGA